MRYELYDDKKKAFLLYSQEIKKHGGDAILCMYDEPDTYPTLSEITTWDIETFLPEQMEAMIQDLNKLKTNLSDKSERDYVDEIIGLCMKCRDNNAGYIIINPFVDRYEFSDEAKARVANSSSKG